MHETITACGVDKYGRTKRSPLSKIRLQHTKKNVSFVSQYEKIAQVIDLFHFGVSDSPVRVNNTR
ncbi:hypothetical protein P3T22_003474 [Paraburkholderia sp. GAS348]